MEALNSVVDIKALFDNIWIGIILRIFVFAIVLKSLHWFIKFLTRGILCIGSTGRLWEH